MSKKTLAKDGYGLVASTSGYQKLALQFPRQFSVVKNTHGKPKGFVPGASECEETGYNYGSEITTIDGQVFKCVDPTSRKAVWVKVPSQVTKQSYVEPDPEPEKEPKEVLKNQRGDEISGTDEAPVTQKEVKDLPEKEDFSDDVIDANTPLEDLPDIPYVGFLKKSQETLGDVVKAANENRVAELSFMNEDRAKKVVAYLRENKYIK